MASPTCTVFPPPTTAHHHPSPLPRPPSAPPRPARACARAPRLRHQAAPPAPAPHAQAGAQADPNPPTPSTLSAPQHPKRPAIRPRAAIHASSQHIAPAQAPLDHRTLPAPARPLLATSIARPTRPHHAPVLSSAARLPNAPTLAPPPRHARRASPSCAPAQTLHPALDRRHNTSAQAPRALSTRASLAFDCFLHSSPPRTRPHGNDPCPPTSSSAAPSPPKPLPPARPAGGYPAVASDRRPARGQRVSWWAPTSKANAGGNH